MRLQFTDILGINKNVEIPTSQFEKALAGDIMFDGSSIEGFVRIEESDMLIVPDLDTFLLPMGRRGQPHLSSHLRHSQPERRAVRRRSARTLKSMLAKAQGMGYTMNAGMEAEFFLFKPDANGTATTDTHDVGGYFDLAPADLGEDARRAMVDTLERMGFEVEAAHHEVAHGQHEIDFRYADALKTADNIATFRFVVKHVATQFGLLASFMPKPIFGQNGSGMHTHQSLFRGKENSFWDSGAEWELSKTALHYIGGILRHARGMCAITNPLVNSYKRLVPGYEAPVNVAWSMRNRSPLIRVGPARTRNALELRRPTGITRTRRRQLAAGLTGSRERLPRAGEREHLGESFREATASTIYARLTSADDGEDDVINSKLGSTHVAFCRSEVVNWRVYHAGMVSYSYLAKTGGKAQAGRAGPRARGHQDDIE
jgi:glutamine synthetase